jgi:alkylation response protein AidB-like acyl-CoA dehydrogenase
MGTVSFAAEYERRIGDPWTGSLGYPATVEADERAEPLRDGLDLLDELRLAAEFVPADHGGRYVSLAGVVAALRAVARHEPGLAFGYGATRLAAALTVWAAGDPEYRRTAADLLKAGRIGYAGPGRVLCTDDWPGTVTARHGAVGSPLHGWRRALAPGGTDLVVMRAMTPGEPGITGEVLAGTPVQRPAPPMVGLRTAAVTDLIFTGEPLSWVQTLRLARGGLAPADAVGDITGIVLPGAAVGVLDTGLRATLRHVQRRRLYGRTAAEQPMVRATLAEAYADLLLCDALVQTALRAADPGRHTPAVRRLVPRILLSAMNRLSTVLGTFFYIRDGHVSVFQKLLRDLQTAFTTPPLAAGEDSVLVAEVGRQLADPLLAEALPIRHERRRLPGELRKALHSDLLDHHADDRALDLTHRKRGSP